MDFHFVNIKKQNKTLLCEVIKLMYRLKDDQLQLHVGDDGICLMRAYECGRYLEMTFEGDRVNVNVFDNHFELIANKTYKWDNKFIRQSDKDSNIMVTTEKLNSLLSLSMVEDYWDGLSLSKLNDQLIENARTVAGLLNIEDADFFVVHDGDGIQIDIPYVPQCELIPNDIQTGYTSVEIYRNEFSISVYDKHNNTLFFRNLTYPQI